MRLRRRLRKIIWAAQRRVSDHRKMSADRRAYRKEHPIEDDFSKAVETLWAGPTRWPPLP